MGLPDLRFLKIRNVGRKTPKIATNLDSPKALHLCGNSIINKAIYENAQLALIGQSGDTSPH